MRVLLKFILLAGLLLCVGASRADTGSDAKEIATLMQKQDFDAIRANFTVNLAQKLSTSQMQSVWQNLLTQVGQVTDIGDAKITTNGNYQIVDVSCTCQNAKIVVRVVYASDGKIDGIWVLPTR
jgi:Protein of unknown function (DUF3887)